MKQSDVKNCKPIAKLFSNAVLKMMGSHREWLNERRQLAGAFSLKEINDMTADKEEAMNRRADEMWGIIEALLSPEMRKEALEWDVSKPEAIEPSPTPP